MTETNKKILYITPNLYTFCKNDLRLLATKYNVVLNIFPWSKKYYTPFFLIAQCFFLLQHIRTSHAIIISFGGYWAFLPSVLSKVFRVPSYLILNGTDCAAMPSINYGMLRKPFLKLICRLSYRLVTKLLPVSESLLYTKNEFYTPPIPVEKLQGVLHFFPKLKTPYQIIHNGINSDFWKNNHTTKKVKNSFLTVFKKDQFVNKGGGLILEFANSKPNFIFYFAGCEKPKTISISKNIHFLGILTPKELKKYYLKTQFYFQLSIFEGFGCALAEAMACECVPIVSNVNILPKIIGNSGFVVNRRNRKDLEFITQKAVNHRNLTALGKEARKRINLKFSNKNRAKQLIDLIQ